MTDAGPMDYGFPSDHHRDAQRVIYSTDAADYDYMRINVPCQSACPAYTNVPAYIRSIHEKRYGHSYELNRMVNLFPGILGRICSRPCENKCRHGEPELGKAVNICHLKRAASDFRAMGAPFLSPMFSSYAKRVCIVGSGPAGLAAAHDLNAIGFDVTILEAMDEPGGMLRYGIPEFRLPRNVLDHEISSILRLGVSLKTGVRVGVDTGFEDIMADYDATLLASGCYVSSRLHVSGENLGGVYSGLEFVMNTAVGKTPKIGKKVVVIGAGFTAFDCARSALRMGAQDVTIFIRGLEEELRVTEDEVYDAKKEGIKIRGLCLTQRIVGNHKVQGVEFLRAGAGETGLNGRRRVYPIEGSNFVFEADSVIVAIGQSAEPSSAPGQKDERGVLIGDGKTFRTSAPNLYMAGDFLTGPSTVIESVASGRKASERIAQDLTGKKFREWVVRMEEAAITDRQRSWDFTPRQEMPALAPVSERIRHGKKEVELGFNEEAALEEARRCYLCYLHYEIDISKCIFCRYCIDNAPRDCIKLVDEIKLGETGAIAGFVETTNWQNVSAVVIDNSRCIRCGECVRVCPVDCISVTKVELVERNLQAGRQ